MLPKELDEYAQWVEKITYDPHEQLWCGYFFPGKVVKMSSFESIGRELVLHVVNETLNLVCDVLGVKTEHVTVKSKNTEYSHARFVATAVVMRRFATSLPTITYIMGYNNHSSVYYALEQIEKKPEIKQKLQKVYRTHPFLYRRNAEIR